MSGHIKQTSTKICSFCSNIPGMSSFFSDYFSQMQGEHKLLCAATSPQGLLSGFLSALCTSSAVPFGHDKAFFFFFKADCK